MKTVLREDETGVSEVVGTILILAMTVVLFSTIILWVSSIPTPVAQTRVDIMASLVPQFTAQGGSQVESGDWVNMTHQGGESMPAASTLIYVTDQKPSGATYNTVVHLATYRPFNATLTYGLLDGAGTSWNVGQRFSFFSTTMNSADKVSVTIVDTIRSIVLWNSVLNPPAGSRPPIFLNVYAARNNIGTPLPVETGLPFYVFAQVMDPDGYSELNLSSAYGTLTYYYGQPSCAQALPMYDDGSPAHGDAVPADGIFTLYYPGSCTSSAVGGMDGSLVLFGIKDKANHLTTTRMTLHVFPGPSGGGSNGGGFGGSGRPPNLRWNGNQGYNIFNASQWDTFGYAASPTRTFKSNETVVLVVGSLTLQNVYGIDAFTLLDPYSGNPAQAVVYGASKTVGSASIPSTSSAFTFFQFVNGYYIYSYRFQLNSQAVGTNFYAAPPSYPRYYYFANYPLSVLLTDSANDRFTTTDSINITSQAGGLRTFPVIKTFKDPYFTQPSSSFLSTAVVYVQVNMLTVNLPNYTGEQGQVFFGNILIQDFAGGQELNRAPTNGLYSNLPICPPIGSCSSTNLAVWSNGGTTSYRFAINLARVNQDPWVAGLQNYALTLSSIKDTDESYSSVSTQIQVQAPLYKMDIVTGNTEGTNSAWGTKDYAYFYQDYNGFDLWKKLRVDYCYAGTSISGVAGSGSTCPSSNDVQVAYGDFWHDGTLGIAESFQAKSGYAVEIYRKAIDASGAVVYLPVFHDTPAVACNAITSGDVTGNGLPSVVCGGTNGWIWYYANNGNWTTTYVDQPTSGFQINSIVVGDFNGDGWNDIAVGGNSGYLKWYPNLGYGRFQNTGISDNWFASTESTKIGNITSGSYLSTYTQDSIYETIQESPLFVPSQNGATTNPTFASGTGWTVAQAYAPASGLVSATGGNPSGSFAQITDSVPPASGSVVAGYWYQPFTVTGSPTFTVNLTLDYELTTYGAGSGGQVAFYAFVDPTAAAPSASPSGCASTGGTCWTSGPLTTTRGWTHVSTVQITGRVPAAGTYYLKVAMYATDASGATASVGGFDNVVLNWISQAGTTSALEQYWRMFPLPTRPGTSFTFKLTGHETGYNVAPGYDNFTLAYSTNVTGSNPTTGTYTTMFTVNTGSDANYQFALPSTVAGLTLWIRVLDTNRVVGATFLGTLSVDYMTINANTPSGTTGIALTGPVSNVNSIDAQSSTHNGYFDLVIGTYNGNVYKYMGSSGGLVYTGSIWYSDGGTPIVGVRWGNFSTSFPGLHIALAFGTTVRIVRGDVGNTVITANLPAFSPSSAITAFGVGDVNGDGWSDCVIGTTGGGLFLWENLGYATSWTYAVQIDNTGAPLYGLAIGDTTNSQFMGT